MRFASIQCKKMQLRPGLCSGPRWGSLQHFPDLLAGFKRVTSRRGRGRGREGGKGSGVASIYLSLFAQALKA